MANKKILILYTSIGMGHKYIALNIGWHLEQAGFEVKMHDIYQLQDGVMVRAGEWLHSLINRRFPFVWRWLYFSKAFSKLTMPFRVPVAGGNREIVKQVIDEFQPDAVIATQTSASAVISYMKQHGEYSGKLIIAFSDYHFHPYWHYKDGDFYLVNIEEQKQELIQRGVASENIAVCGITLKPKQSVDEQSVKQKLSLEDKDVVLMSSGSLGIGFPESLLLEYVKQLGKANPRALVVVVCGKNESMKKYLETQAAKQNLAMTVLGFYEPMAELYAISKVFLTKPGGLTVAEALRDNVKMLTTHFLPGQEELNYKYLTDRKLIEPIPNPLNAENLVKITQDIILKNEQTENANSAVITQKNSEGTLLIKSIKKWLSIV